MRGWVWSMVLGWVALVCCGWSLFPTLDAAPLLRVAMFSCGGLGMLGLVFFFPNTSDRTAARLVLAAAIFLRLLLWPAPVSDDVNRYFWEGQLVRDGGNPYSAPASAEVWKNRRDATWQAMNHRDRPTAYPPGAQWIMAATTVLAPGHAGFKVLALAGDGATLLLLLALLCRQGLPIRWAGFYAFNPVVLIAFAAEAHFDSLMIAAMLAALLAAEKGQRTAWLWLGLAIQIKLVCLVLLPFFLTRRLAQGIWMFLLVVILPSLPFSSGIVEWVAGVKTFASAGAFNGPLHTLLASTGLDLEIVRPLCNLVFTGWVLAICMASWRGLARADGMLAMLGGLLACSPIVHFWYVAWLLPLVALRPSFAWSTLSITLGGYFLAWWTEAHRGWWGYGHGIAAVIWLPWLLAGLAQHRHFVFRRQLRRFQPEPFQLTIILPVLNVGVELRSLIATLRQEAGASCEFVIVDGGSDEGLVPQFEQPQLRVIPSARGRGNQIAAGISITRTPWVMIVHADSTPRPGWLGDVSAAVDRHPHASLLVFGQRFDRFSPGTLWIEALNEARVVFGGVAFGDQTMVIRRAALDAAGGFPAQPLMEDVEVSIRLAGQGRVVYLGREWKLSASKWEKNFGRRVLMIFRLVASYQIARMKTPAHAARLSERMYQEYYPPGPDEDLAKCADSDPRSQ